MDIFVYDKAKYHEETVDEYGLPDEHTCSHTLIFLKWLVDNDLMSDVFLSEGQILQDYRSGKCGILAVYDWWDRALVSDMLNEIGNKFAMAYFEFDKGSYLIDYGDLLVKDLPSQYHVRFTDDNYGIMKAAIDKRYADFMGKNNKRKWWPFR